LDSVPEVFFDPNQLSEDGTVALSTTEFSDDGSLFGYALSKSGSDWVTIHVKRVSDGKDLDDKIEFAKFTGISWTKDNQGFFYTRYPRVTTSDLGTETDANENAQTYYHVLGTQQKEDTLVFADPEHPTYRGYVSASDCGQYLMLSVTASTAHKNKLWIAPWSSKQDPQRAQLAALKWTKLVDEIDQGSFDYLTNINKVFYFQSNFNAPNQRIIKYDLDHPELGFVNIVPEKKSETLAFATVVAQTKLILVYMKDVKHVIYMVDLLSGAQLREIDLPTVASVDGLSGKIKQTEFFYRYSSYLSPGTIVRYDCTTMTSSSWKEIQVPGFKSAEFEAKQVFYPSKDGTKIPMFLIHRKDLTLDGTAPTLCYGYGGFNIPLTPSFVPGWLGFIQSYDAVVAVANLRGGGEYGESWHEAGMKANKQNVFDDFQYAAKYLINKGYTSPSKLAINGGSNGGLLVAACANQAPELYAAAVGEVGVLDMLRFHKWTIGSAWRADYGDPDVADEFAYIYPYSPYHNVRTQTYPAMLLMTSDHDDRVVPVHSYKYIAQLQHMNPNNLNPLLIHIERKAGHGAGKPTKKRIESAAIRFSFMAMATGAQWKAQL
jgi:prolyl oligopeptidase